MLAITLCPRARGHALTVLCAVDKGASRDVLAIGVESGIAGSITSLGVAGEARERHGSGKGKDGEESGPVHLEDEVWRRV